MKSSLPVYLPSQQKILRGMLIAGGLYLGYRFTRQVWQKQRARSTSVLADQSPAVRQAMGLRSAMNPSGISWLMWADGTREDAIAQIATQISDLDSVAAAYRKLYGAELLADLQSELSVSRFNAFLQTVASNRVNQSQNRSLPNASGGAYTAAGRLIVAKQAVFVRTSPDASYNGAWYEFTAQKNIFKTAQPGEFIGYATGRQHFDSGNNVKFIEVAYQVGPGAPEPWRPFIGQSLLRWVSASSLYTEQFASAQAMEARYPQSRRQRAFLLPLSSLGWLSIKGSRARTKVATPLMDEQFEVIGAAQPGVILGYPVMSLEGNGHHYTLVRNTRGQDRWIRSQDIQMQ